jgi:DNA-binding transcriptional LysR family regulator
MPMRVRLEAEFATANTRLPVEHVESVSLIINETLLLASDMVTVVSQQLAQHYEQAGTLAILPLVMRQALGPVGLLWSDATPSNAVQRFLDSVREEARALDVGRKRKGSAPAPRPKDIRQRRRK